MKQAIALSLCGVVVLSLGALWARSLVRVDDLSYTSPAQRVYGVMSYLGGLHLMTIADQPSAGVQVKRETISAETGRGFDRVWNAYYPVPMTELHGLGFAYVHGWYNPTADKNGMPPMPYRAVVIPYWFLVGCGISAGIISCWKAGL